MCIIMCTEKSKQTEVHLPVSSCPALHTHVYTVDPPKKRYHYRLPFDRSVLRTVLFFRFTVSRPFFFVQSTVHGLVACCSTAFS